jgi:hypothetical protein
MSENLLPGKDRTALIEEMLEGLEKAFRLAGTSINGLRYYEDSDVVRIGINNSFSICIDVKNTRVIRILYRILEKSEPFLYDKDFKESLSWHRSLCSICKREE